MFAEPIVKCVNCDWVGVEDDLEAGIPHDVDVMGDGAEIEYYAATPSCCPECSHSVAVIHGDD